MHAHDPFTSDILDPLFLSLVIASISSLALVLALLALRRLRKELLRTRSEQTLLQSLEQKSSKQQQLFRSLIRHTPGIAFRCAPDEDWTLSFISDAVESTTGWPAEDFIARRKFFRDIVHVDDYPRIVAEAIRAISENRGFQFEYRMLHRDGRVFWVWAQGSAFYDTQDRLQWVDGVIIDIDQRKATELALHESERLAASLLSNIRGVSMRALANDVGSLLFVSEGIERLTGWTVAEFMARHPALSDLGHPDDRDRVRAEVLASLGASGNYSVEYRMLRRDGSSLWILSHGTLVQDPQQKAQWIDIVIMDISERHAMERALRQAKEEAERRAEAAEARLAR